MKKEPSTWLEVCHSKKKEVSMLLSEPTTYSNPVSKHQCFRHYYSCSLKSIPADYWILISS